LYLDGFFNFAHILHGYNSCAFEESCFTNSSKLIRHGLTFFASKKDQCFTGIETVRLAGEGHNLDSVRKLIGCVVADDHGRALLPGFPADGRIKIDPPDSRRFI